MGQFWALPIREIIIVPSRNSEPTPFVEKTAKRAQSNVLGEYFIIRGLGGCILQRGNSVSTSRQW